jgi:alanyl-tRNA synthetase
VTERLYYNDSYLRRFEAAILDVADEGKRVYLDRTAFYPNSGGQPSDRGTLNGVAVLDVIDEEDRIAHVLERPLPSLATVAGEIDWARRFDHAQQHSGQHLLSAVFHRDFGLATVSFHLGSEASTIDLATGSIDADTLAQAERAANAIVFENRPLGVSYEESPGDLRKESQRSGTLRIISIADLDRSACGGTHVKSTGEIGPILVRKTEKIRNTIRLEFLCGMRAVEQARRDYDGLVRAAQVFSSSLADVPEMVASMQSRLVESEKARKKLGLEVATMRGKQRYSETAPGEDGLRRLRLDVPAIEEEARAEAQSFVAGSKAVMLMVASASPSLLLAVSADSGLLAGKQLGDLLKAAGGRGGGSAQVGQGSVPDREALERIAKALGF